MDSRSELSRLTNEELIHIVEDYDSLAKLEAAFEKNKDRTHKLIMQTGCSARVASLNTHNISRSLIHAIELSSLSVDIFWLVISFADLEALSVLLISMVGIVTLLIGVGLFYYSYYSNKKDMQNKQEYLTIEKLRVQALDELMYREDPLMESTLKKGSHNPSTEHPSKITSVLTGITVSLVLTATFFWAITDMLTTLELISAASMITGPFGLLIASIGALVIGLYLGKMHYDAHKNLGLIQSESTLLHDEYEQKLGKYQGMLDDKRRLLSQTAEPNFSNLTQGKATALVTKGAVYPVLSNMQRQQESLQHLKTQMREDASSSTLIPHPVLKAAASDPSSIYLRRNSIFKHDPTGSLVVRSAKLNRSYSAPHL